MKIIDKLNEIHGKVVKRFVILGFPIFSLTQTNAEHFNLYVCCVPLFRINKKGKVCNVHILPLVWIYKAIRSLIDFIYRPIKLKKDYDNMFQKSLEYRTKPEFRKELLEKLERGEKIKVCLFESRISCWQYEKLYDLLKNSPYFEPVVVLKPFVFQGKETMISLMNDAYDILSAEGYNVVKGYDEETDQYLDVKEVIAPDVVFYSMYWKQHFEPSFYVDHFESIYSFLFAYGYDIASHPIHESMNFELQNKVTRYYLPTKVHKRIAELNMDSLGTNTLPTGSPKLDLFLDKNYTPADVWKPQPVRKKRIIWAPHHSDGFSAQYYQFNAFYEIYDFMFELAEKYKDSIQIAFKPHPMLKPKLDQRWGREKADEYYNRWAELENGQLEQGEFKDLFLGSDAMILDSISFIAEYTITNKPAFFTIGKTSRVNLNTFGKKIFKELYKPNGDLKKGIEDFVVNVVINGNDYQRKKRTQFINEYMLPPNGISASENIYNDMVDIIINGKYRRR